LTPSRFGHIVARHSIGTLVNLWTERERLIW
jgi:hypothetical protein